MLRESFPFPVSSVAFFISRRITCNRHAGGGRQIPRKNQRRRVPGAFMGSPSGENVRFIKGEPKRDIGLILPTGRDSPPLVLGRTYGRSRLRSAAPVSHSASKAAMPCRGEPVPSLKRWAAECAEPQRRGE